VASTGNYRTGGFSGKTFTWPVILRATTSGSSRKGRASTRANGNVVNVPFESPLLPALARVDCSVTLSIPTPGRAVLRCLQQSARWIDGQCGGRVAFARRL